MNAALKMVMLDLVQLVIFFALLHMNAAPDWAAFGFALVITLMPPRRRPSI